MTVLDLIGRSLRLLGVIDPIETPSAESAVTAIAALNAMCRRWEANGNAFGWRDVASAQDELPAPDELHACLAFNLAVELAPEYGAPIPAVVATRAVELLDDLRRDVIVAHPIEPILDVPTPQQVGGASRLGWPGSWYGES